MTPYDYGKWTKVYLFGPNYEEWLAGHIRYHDPRASRGEAWYEHGRYIKSFGLSHINIHKDYSQYRFLSEDLKKGRVI